jgi:DNA polymerase-3 subunit delta
MTEINYKELNSHIKSAEKEGFSRLYLIHGEELMCKTALEELLGALLPESASDRNHNYHPVDGTGENISDALERVNTFSFMSGRKVVAYLDSKIFYSKENEKSLLEKAKEAHALKDLKKAARYFTSLMSILKLSFDDVGKENRRKSLKMDAGEADSRWIDDITEYCIGNGIVISGGEESASFFQKAVEKGFPKGNHLIVTAEIVDKRLSLYKAVNKNGVIIDCQIPKGDSRNEKEAREKVLLERMNAVLLKNDKTMEKAAYNAMFEMTGFDPRTFSNNLEKLISYTGTRNKITLEDVETVLKRTRLDPIYELTNAVSERNLSDSLFYLDSLLSSEIHPLQALSALINQFRKIICIKGFTGSRYGKAWEPGFTYPRFTSVTLPAIEEYDNTLLKEIEDRENFLADEESSGKSEERGKKPAKKKSKPVTDILISKTVKNPYALYQLARKSENFTEEEILSIFERLKDADLELKSSGRNPKLAVENVILHICRKK